MIENYEINESTLAVIPLSKNESLVMEEEESYTVLQNTTTILDNSCRFFGSSYLGRHMGTQALIGTKYKTPIIVEESKNLIFFPTSSPKKSLCYWISLNHVKNYEKNGENTQLTFKNGKKITLNVSKYAIENQILRASRLDSVLTKRKAM